MIRAFLKGTSGPGELRGWRSLPMLLAFVAILVSLPQARALLTGGILGGIVIGAVLIVVRHQFGSGPRRGTPIVLFPRSVTAET